MHWWLVGLWFLVFCFVLCALPFCCPRLLWLYKNKTRRQLSLAAGHSRIVFSRFGLSAQEHDRQPATSMVVMPVSIVAVICSKHRSGFIPDEQGSCQTLGVGCYWFIFAFSTYLGLTIQALHWDRGRPARNERAARTERLKLATFARDPRTLRCS